MSNESRGFDDFGEEEGGVGIPAQLRDPIRVLRRQLPWILISLVGLLIATAVATFSFPLQYEARSTILLTEKSIPDQFVPTTIMDNIIEQFEAIRGEVFSRDSLATIVSETGVYAADLPNVPITNLAARLANDLSIETLPSAATGRGPARSVSFAVKMSGPEPEVLADVVNRVVAELIDANVEYRSSQARVTTQFMQREFDRADEALRVHQRKLAAFRAEHRGGALPEEQEASLSKLERLEDQRRSAILQISELRARLERIDRRPQGAGGSDDLDSLLASLQSARALYTDDHPTVRSLQRQVDELQKAPSPGSSTSSPATLEERSDVARALEREKARLVQIDQSVRSLDQRLSTAPEIVEEYSAMIREEKILQENYVEFLRKLKSAELSLSLEHSQQGAQLIRLDKALPPTAPVMPRWMVAAAGIIVSIGVSLVIGLGIEFLFPVIIDVPHLEAEIPVPCLGSINEIV